MDVAVAPLQRHLGAGGRVGPPEADRVPQLPVERVRGVVLPAVQPRATQTQEEVVADLDVGGALRVEWGGGRRRRRLGGGGGPDGGLQTFVGRGGGRRRVREQLAAALGRRDERDAGEPGGAADDRLGLQDPGRRRGGGGGAFGPCGRWTPALLRGPGGEMHGDAVRVHGPGHVHLLGSHGVPHREAGVGVGRDLQLDERRAQEADLGGFGRGLRNHDVVFLLSLRVFG